MSTAAGTASQQEFLEELLCRRHFLPSGEPGIYGRGMVFEDVQTRIDSLITRVGAIDHAEKLRFPPVISKRTLERAAYLKSFPHLCGVVYSFSGNEADALDLMERVNRGDGWGAHLSTTDVALVPAACYPAYPSIASRGQLPQEGMTLDLGACWVFRNEPSGDPARLQMFHQREMVRIGEAEQVLAWRDTWMNRAKDIFARLGLDATLGLASDPFFGRGRKLLATNQREQSLKFEILVPIASPQPTAVASFNFHLEHFGSAFDIQLHDGRVASSACLGFGLERITLALLRAHGMNVSEWPEEVRHELLWPGPGLFRQ